MSYLGNEPYIGPNARDKFAGTGSQVAFTLSRAPSQADGILVAISGVLQDSATYSVAAKILTFSEAPPAPSVGVATNIEVIFLGRQGAPMTANWVIPIVTGGGTADAITAAFNPAITSLTDNLVVKVVIAGTNASTTPTFNPNGLGAGTVVSPDGTAVVAGQLKGTLELRYDLGATNWKLLTPAVVPAPVTTSKIQPITASVAANALTVSLQPTLIDFRSATLTSGTVNTRTVGTTISLVIPNTATLGTISAQLSRLVVIALDNAGTVELAIVNIAGGNSLDETGVISTTILNASSTSASTIYSTTARSNVAYRVVGFVESTQATAGTWATTPSTIQGFGGNVTFPTLGHGYGQTYQEMVGSRSSGVTYYNTTGKPIGVFASNNTNNATTDFVVGGVTIPRYTSYSSACSYVLVPPGFSYSATSSTGTFNSFVELR